MIKAVIYRTENERDDIFGFKITNHGDSFLCAAVSMLSLNTVNSLKALTDCSLEYCYDAGGGYIECILPGILSGEDDPEAALLLNSLALGLKSAQAMYGKGDEGISLTTKRKPLDYAITTKKQSTIYTR